MKTYWESVRTAPRILDLGTRLRWVVSFMPWPLFSQGKSPWYPLDRLGGPQSRSGRGGEEKNSQPPPGIESKYRRFKFLSQPEPLLCNINLTITCKLPLSQLLLTMKKTFIQNSDEPFDYLVSGNIINGVNWFLICQWRSVRICNIKRYTNEIVATSEQKQSTDSLIHEHGGGGKSCSNTQEFNLKALN
jgi:hypothetical protein